MSVPQPTTTQAIESGWRSLALFARNFVRHPLSVGTCVPSSPWVVERALAMADVENMHTLVEYGPGVGTFTAALLERMRRQARLVAIESNIEFVEHMRQQPQLADPRLSLLHGSAADAVELLRRRGIHGADLVVSGIPLGALPASTRKPLIDATAALIGEHGRLLVYQYSTAAERLLSPRFELLQRAVEWRNLWPMRLYLYRRRVH